MQRDADTLISTNDKTFITEALAVELRMDGRGLYDYRKIRFEFAPDDSSATLVLGSTRVTAVITGALEAPYPDRPSEGAIRFNVECGPMASPAFDAGRPGPDAVQLARLVERALKQSGAVDCEALCVIAGRKVWSLRCDVHVLDHGGNLVDACILAALAAVMVYRKPEVTVGGDSGTEVIIHPREIREPVPLTIHHTPVSVTWALFQSASAGTVAIIDPNLREQAAQAGSATVMVNTSDEVCGIHKAEGLGLTAAEVMRLVRLSCVEAKALVAALREALQAHEVARVAARVQRTQRSAFTVGPSRYVSISTGGPAQGTAQKRTAMDMDQSMSGLQGADEAMSGPDDDSSDASDEDSQDSSEEEDASEEDQAMSDEGPEQQAMPQPSARLGPRLLPAAQAEPSIPAQPQVASTKPAGARQQTSAKRRVPHVPQPRLDDNLETIAALIAGTPQGAASAGQVDGDLSLTSAIKQQNLQKRRQSPQMKTA